MKKLLTIVLITIGAISAYSQTCGINDQVTIHLADEQNPTIENALDSVQKDTPVYFRVSLYDAGCYGLNLNLKYNGDLISVMGLHEGVLLEEGLTGYTNIWRYDYSGFDTAGDFVLKVYPSGYPVSIKIYEPVVSGLNDEVNEEDALETIVYTTTGEIVDQYQGAFKSDNLESGFFMYKTILKNGSKVSGKYFN